MSEQTTCQPAPFGDVRRRGRMHVTNRINVDDFIDKSPMVQLQWRVVLICFVLAMIDGFDAQIVGYAAPLLIDHYSLSLEQMGRVYSSALVGLMIGALVCSPISDSIGRKPVIVVSAVVMGVFALLTPLAQGPVDLCVYRFLTGLGLGGVMPNINILTAEFSPSRRRAMIMTLMFSGFPVGTIVGGLLSAVLLQYMGWQSIFIIGGLLPLVIVPVLLIWLPESPRFLASRGTRGDNLYQIMSKIDTSGLLSAETQLYSSQPDAKSGTVSSLFSNGRAGITLLLWFVFFANLLAIYAMFGWLPTVLKSAGLSLERAILVTTVFSVGGIVGGLAIAKSVDTVGAKKTLSFAFFVGAVAIIMVGQAVHSIPFLIVSIFLVGTSAMGAQFGLNAMASDCYDVNARATGLGWALAIGRLGAIMGPLAVGTALDLEVSMEMLFVLGAAPMFLAAFAVALAGSLTERRG